MAGTHFRNPVMFAGLSNNTKWFKDLPVDNNPNFVCYKDDFIYNTLPASEWSTSIADGGASAGISNEVGGAVTLTSANTTDNNGIALVKTQNSFQAVAETTDSSGAVTNPGTVIWYEARIKNNDANATDYGTGLCETFVGTSGWRSANRISIESNNGEQFYRFVTRNAAGTNQVQYSSYTITDDGYDTVGFRVDKAGKVEFFVNRALAATVTSNINTDDMQMFAASVSASAAGQRVTTLDYITATQNRNASELIGKI
jgi:hypothetical protein|tara:strand:+ start:42 stop:812 length:771 start_codon:yes stop_codon:yes gene_type:complete